MKGKKLLALFLAIVMTLSVLPVTVIVAAEETLTYTKVETMEIGKEYLLVAAGNSGSYALANDSNIKMSVTPSGNTVTLTASEADKATWTVSAATGKAATKGALVLTNNGKYLSRATSTNVVSFITTDSARNGMTVGSGTIYGKSTSNDNYYLGYGTVSGSSSSTSTFRFATTTSGTISFYEKEQKQQPQTETVYVAFTSDVHNASGNQSANRLNRWINNVSALLGDVTFDAMGFCGDNATSSASGSTYWNYVTAVKDTVAANDKVVDAYYTAGNHEWYNGNGENAAHGLLEVGVAKETDSYVIFCFGATQQSEIFTDSSISALRAALEAAGNKPFFILSHYPLHTYNNGSGESPSVHDGKATQGTSKVVELLNNYPNAVFLWGHNHSQNQEQYDEIHHALNGTPINFTYCAAGCMSDSEYGWGSGSVKGKGLVAAITGSKGTLTYYDADANMIATGSFGSDNGGEDPDEPQVPTVPTYTKVDTVVAGEEYLIVATSSSGKTYVLANASNIKLQVNPDGDTITLSDEDAAAATWAVEATTAGELVFTNGGKYLQRSSSSVAFASSTGSYTAMKLGGGSLTNAGSASTYYLGYGSTGSSYGSSGEYTFRFATTATDNISFYVKDSGVPTYTVTFKDGDTVVATKTYKEGATITYTAPEKDSDGNYSYTFDHFEPALAVVTGNASYQLVYNKTKLENATYQKVDQLVVGKEYLIVGVSSGSGKAYALANASNIKLLVTPNGNEITLSPEDAATATWTVAAATGEAAERGSLVLSNNGKYLQRSSSGVAFSSTTGSYTGMKQSGGTLTSAGTSNTNYLGYGSVSGQNDYTFRFATTSTDNISFYEKVENTEKVYTVIWMADGKVLQEKTFKEGDPIPEYTGETPTKAPTVQYTYTFAGWLESVSEDGLTITYTALFEQTVNSYTVSFVCEGETLDEQTYAYGSVLTYEAPAKDGYKTVYTPAYIPGTTTVTGDASYEVSYDDNRATYTVIWMADGKVLQEKPFKEGEVEPAYTGATPTKAPTVQYSYTFAGWLDSVSEDGLTITYTALFEQTVNSYTVSFVCDGETLDEQTYAYGSVLTYEAPAKDGYKTVYTPDYIPGTTTVTGDASYEVSYSELSAVTYTVIWMANGEEKERKTFKEGEEEPAYTGATPTKASTAQYTYTFAEWLRSESEDKLTITYTATFTATVRSYTVTFVDGDVIVARESYNYGDEITYVAPTKPGYDFVRFDPAKKTVTGNQTYSLIYKEQTPPSSDPVYVAFTSDVHNGSDNQSANRLNSWINNVSAALGNVTFDAMGFCGDSGNANAYGSTFWNYVTVVQNTVASNNKVNGDGIFTAGNHEWMNGSGQNAEHGLLEVGVAKETDSYVIFCFGATQQNEIFTDASISALRAALEAAGGKPFFILSHYPLHTYRNGSGESSSVHDGKATQGTAKVVELLNNYPNAVFLWGHNHSSNQEQYDDIHQELNGKPINFIYCAAGCMSDREYGQSINVKGKGLAVKIEGSKLTLTYYTENASKVAEKEIVIKGTTYTVTFVDGDTGEVLSKQTCWEGSMPTAPSKPGYKLVKTVPALVSVTENATYEVYYEKIELEGGYLLVSNGMALTTATGESYTNSSNYYYSGLAGVQYSENMELTADMVWQITPNADGSYTISNGGQILNASYVAASGSSSGATAKVWLGSETDSWTFSKEPGSETVTGVTLLSKNANKYLTYGNPSASTNPNTFSVRSNNNQTTFTIIPVGDVEPILTVTWIVEGKVVATATFKQGDPIPEYPGATPTKPEDSLYTYTFAGWDTVKDAKGNLTNTAKFTATLKNPELYRNSYLIISEGMALTTGAGENYTNSSSYNYSGLAGVRYTEGMTLTADMLWKITPNADGTYTILSSDGRTLNGSYVYATGSSSGATSKVWLGSEADTWTLSQTIGSETVTGVTIRSTTASQNSENSPKYLAHGNPSEQNSNPNTFAMRSESYLTTFTIIPVQSEEEDPTLTATWIVEGVVVATATFKQGEAVPAYAGETPTKPASGKVSYRFFGWEAAEDESGNVTYTAIFYAIGDFNGDGILSISDVSLLLAQMAKPRDQLSEVEKFICDVNGDGILSISDVSLLSGKL